MKLGFTTNMDCPSYHELYVGPRPTNVYNIPHGVIIDISKSPNLIKELNAVFEAATRDFSNATSNQDTCLPDINRVYSHNPYTIVLWSDKTKTIVKAQDGEAYDPEKGLAMAISKKALGNKGSYYEVFKRYLIWPEEVEAIENGNYLSVEELERREIFEKSLEDSEKLYKRAILCENKEDSSND